MSAGKKFKELVKTSKPLTIVGAVNVIVLYKLLK